MKREQNWSNRKSSRYMNRFSQSEEYRQLYEKSDGRCNICNEIAEKLCIDHDHETGAIRGLLCNGCNLGLGHLEKLIGAAQKYLIQEQSLFLRDFPPRTADELREISRRTFSDPVTHAKRVKTRNRPEVKEKISESLRAAWADPIKRASRIEALKAGWQRKKERTRNG